MSQQELQRLLLAARQAVKSGEARRALALLEVAQRLEPRSPLVHFTMGQAAAALGQAAAAADAFRRCTELTAHAQPGTQLHALHQTATDNLLLESAAVLPPSWIASLHDEPWLAALQAGIAAALQQASQCSSDGTQLPPRVLVCGGLGLEAVLAAQAGAQHVAMLCQDNPLTARLAAELAAASGCADRVTTATSADQLGAGAQPGGYNLVILADALGSSVDWGLLQRQLAAVAPLLVQHGGSSGSGQHCAAAASIVLPHAVRICGQLVQCAAAVALNQVDVEQMAADTGGLDLSTANELLPRARRSLQLPSYQHTALSSPTTLLTVPLASLLSCSVEDGSTASHQPASGRMAVTTAGSADALCWWLEQQVVADGADEPQQQPPLLSSSPSSCPAGEAALHLHIWQHLEYMNRQQLAAGEAVDVRCQLGGSSGGGGGGSSGAAYVAASGMQDLSLGDIPASGKAAASLNFSVQLQDGSSGSGSTAGQSLLLPVTSEQAAVAAAVPQYHTSMLNDSARTVAYRDGIAAAMLEAEAKAAAAAAADSQPQPRRPLVLEIGSGSGLLLLLARKAGASHSVGCERLPELQQVAAQLLQANGAAHSVAVLPKHSRELAVAEGSSGSGSGNDEVSSAADLPRRADVLLHEIFGTDPFSEGVVPSLAHARQHLLAPNAVLAPCKLHVVAAIAASSTHAHLLRPPAAVCGSSVRTAALSQLAPRKMDCQVSKAGGLFLLTEPGTVLSVDFAADELPLADSATALLQCLPAPVSVAAWAAVQRQQAGAAAAAAARPAAESAAGGLDGAGGSAVPQPGSGASLFAVSWFEYEFPGGVHGSSAPYLQRSEHWQQVVQPLEGPVAEAALAALLGGSAQGGSGEGSGSCEGCGSGSSSGSGSQASGSEHAVAALLLTAGYRVDRLWFELAGIAAAAGEEEEESSGEEA